MCKIQTVPSSVDCWCPKTVAAPESYRHVIPTLGGTYQLILRQYCSETVPFLGFKMTSLFEK